MPNKNNRFLLPFLLLVHSAQFLAAQPALDWDLTFGGISYEELNGLKVHQNAIYIGGSSRSALNFGQPGDTSWNVLFTKTNFEGQVLWHKMLDANRNDRLWTLMVTSDGGLLAGGYSYSDALGDKSQPSRGGMDVWVIRLDTAGNKIWDRTFGGTGRDELFSILEMPDGSFILGCHSNSNAGGDKSEMSRGELDFWLIGMDANGNKLWDKTIGGNAEDQIHDLALLPSGNILASGGTVSQRNTGEVGPDFARGAKDYWILEFDPTSRQVVWNRRHGGTNDDFAYALLVTSGGKIFLGGRSASGIAPPTAINNGKNAPFYGGDSDYWLLELDANGQKRNEWSFGGNGLDDLYYLQENERRDICIGGVTDSGISGNKTTPLRGGYDFWLIGIDTLGNQLWQKTVGGGDIDALTRIDLMPNGAMVLGGHSQSNAGFEKSDASFGVNDFWVVTTLCNTTVAIDNTPIANYCAGEPALLTALTTDCADCLYLWNTGATTASIEVEPGTSGEYSVKVINELGCIALDTANVSLPQPPVINIGPSDTLILANNTLILGQNNPEWTYQWSTGAQTPTIQVTTPGVYAVTVTDGNGCSATDAILVRMRREVLIYAPTAFSPDLDGVNDYFTLYTNDGVERILELQIADRWGELIYRKRDFFPNNDVDGWDGRYRGKWAEVGVYIWSAEVLLSDGEKRHLEGDITIIR